MCLDAATQSIKRKDEWFVRCGYNFLLLSKSLKQNKYVYLNYNVFSATTESFRNISCNRISILSFSWFYPVEPKIFILSHIAISFLLLPCTFLPFNLFFFFCCFAEIKRKINFYYYFLYCINNACVTDMHMCAHYSLFREIIYTVRTQTQKKSITFYYIRYRVIHININVLLFLLKSSKSLNKKSYSVLYLCITITIITIK